MSSDILMEITKQSGKIDGESKLDGHVNWIEVDSYSWGGSNPGGSWSTSGSANVSVGHLQDISISKQSDKADPILMRHCIDGEHLGEVTIKKYVSVGSKGDAESGKTPSVMYILEDVVVSSCQIGGMTGGLEQTQLSFNAKKFTYNYYPNDPETGNPGTSPVTFVWNQAEGKTETPSTE